jgi:hypothetical protein
MHYIEAVGCKKESKMRRPIPFFLVLLLSSTANAALTWSKDGICLNGSQRVSVQIYSDSNEPYEVWMGNEPSIVAEITDVVPYPDAGDAVVTDPAGTTYPGWWLLRSENNMRGVHWEVTIQGLYIGTDVIYTDLYEAAGANDMLTINLIGAYCPLFLPEDIDTDGDVDFYDYAILARAWLSIPGDDNWHTPCDIAEPKDGIIDELDLLDLVEDWLIQYTP